MTSPVHLPSELLDEHDITPEPAPEPPTERWASRLAVASVIVAVVPIFVAALRAALHHWLPVGDNAYFAMRARDVFTEHHPWLGTWTSASDSLGVDLNNPGPLFFDLLAVPARIGRGTGLAFGVAVLNAGAVIGIAVTARRLGGARLVVATMAMAAALAWTMGSELLFDPWQPHSMVLPFLCYLVMVWAIFSGDGAMLPWAAFVASLLVQTHLSFAVLTLGLALWAVGGLAWHLRSVAPASAPESAALRRRKATRLALVTGLVLAAAWSQPIIEQIAGEGKGNLGRIASSIGSEQESVGLVRGGRLVVDVLALPPWWARPSFGDALVTAGVSPYGPGYDDETTSLPGSVVSAAALVGVVTVLVALAVLAFRRRDRVATSMAATAACAVGLAMLTATLLPIGQFGIPPHQLRWAWPVAVFATLAVAVVLTRLEPVRVGSISMVSGAFAAVTLVFSALNLPYYNQEVGPSADADAIPVVRQLNPQLRALQGSGPLLFDVTGQRFAEPYSIAVQAELQRLGVPFVVSDEGLVRQLGDRRRFDGDAAARIFLREGPAARRPPPGATRVAFAEGLAADDQRKLDALRAEVAGYVADRGVVLNARGQAALEPGTRPPLDPAAVDVEQLLDDRVLAAAVLAGYLDIEPAWVDRFDRYAELQRDEDLLTVAVFIAPLEPG